MKMKKFYALFNTFQCIGIDIGIGLLCNCHIGICIGQYENQIYQWLSVLANMKKFLSVAHYDGRPKLENTKTIQAEILIRFTKQKFSVY